MSDPSKITHLIVHCAYTPINMDIGVKEIDRWHKEKGWLGIGYHAVIRRDGTVEDGRPLEKTGAHVKNMNTVSKGITLIGGMSADKKHPEINYTDEQWVSLRTKLTEWLVLFPNAKIAGHTDFDKGKTCPNFDANHWWNTGEIVQTF